MEIEAGLLRAVTIGLAGSKSGQRTHGDVLEVRQGAQPLRGFIAVDARQADIAQHEFRPKTRGDFQGRGATPGEQHFVSFQPQ